MSMPRLEWEQAVVRLAPRVVVQTIGGEGLLLNLQTEAVFALNESGVRVAEHLALGRRVSLIVADLADVYGLGPDQIAGDVGVLLETLFARGLIVVEPAGGGP
jgi:hypothetical protein